MAEHKKHGVHPHDKMAAMPQFNEGHWEKKLDCNAVGDEKYGEEMKEPEEYKRAGDALAAYAKKHKMKY